MPLSLAWRRPHFWAFPGGSEGLHPTSDLRSEWTASVHRNACLQGHLSLAHCGLRVSFSLSHSLSLSLCSLAFARLESRSACGLDCRVRSLSKGKQGEGSILVRGVSGVPPLKPTNEGRNGTEDLNLKNLAETRTSRAHACLCWNLGHSLQAPFCSLTPQYLSTLRDARPRPFKKFKEGPAPGQQGRRLVLGLRAFPRERSTIRRSHEKPNGTMGRAAGQSRVMVGARRDGAQASQPASTVLRQSSLRGTA